MHPTVEAWLDAMYRQGKSTHTIAAYTRGLAHFARRSEQTYGESFDPARVIPRDVRDWIAYQPPVASSTRRATLVHREQPESKSEYRFVIHLLLL